MNELVQSKATNLRVSGQCEALLDSNLRVVAANRGMLKWLARDGELLIGQEITAVFPQLAPSQNALKQLAYTRQGSRTFRNLQPATSSTRLTLVFSPFMLAGNLLSLTAYLLKESANLEQEVAPPKAKPIGNAKQPSGHGQAELRRQATLIENVHDAIISTDKELKILSWNNAAERIYGWRSEEVVGKALDQVLPTTFLEHQPESVIESLSNAGQWEGVMVQERKDGEKLYIQSASTVLVDDAGQPAGIVAVNRDITERRLVEERVRRAEEHYRRLFEEAPVMYATTLMDGALIADCNLLFCKTLGYERDEVLKQPLFKFYTAESKRKAEVEGYQQALLGNFVTQERQFVTKDGRIVTTFLSASPMADKQGKVIGTHTMYVDISALKATEAERETLFNKLNKAHERLRLLSRNQVETAEMERRRIARELHDEIGQTLTAVKLQLQSMQRLFEEPNTQQHLGESIVVVDQALMQVRDISLNLRPSLLDDFGLVATLRWYVDRQSQWADFEASFTTNMEDERLPADLESVCFRIVQEALTNVIRHARAKNVSIAIEKFGFQLQLRIQDDGIGFDVAQAMNEAALGKSLGLLSMEERVLLVNGSLNMTSSAQSGSLIEVFIPL